MNEPEVVLHPRHPRGVAEALRGVDGIEVLEPEETSLLAVLQHAEILVSFVWDDSYLGTGLRWIQSISAGVDQFPLDRLESAGVVLTSASGLHAVPVAEHAFALLLALTRGVGVSMREAETKVWKPRMNQELSGRTMVVLGLGAIGEEIARRAAAWGMHVIGVKRNPDNHRGNAHSVVSSHRLVEAAGRADVLVSVLPGGPGTGELIDRRVLTALGGGWLVNVGRGTVVAESDLVWALEEGHLRGAGLDVFEQEPLPKDSALWSHPRVVITPHTAGLSPEYGPRLAEIFRHNLRAFIGVGDWRNRIV